MLDVAFAPKQTVPLWQATCHDLTLQPLAGAKEFLGGHAGRDLRAAITTRFG